MEEKTIDECMDALPGTITRDGIKYRFTINKSRKGKYTICYRPLHGKLPPLMVVTGFHFESLVIHAVTKFNALKEEWKNAKGN